MKALRWAGLALGLLIVGFLIHEVGWASITSSLGLLGSGYFIVLLYPLVWILLNTEGWYSVVAVHHPEIAFATLFRIRLAGESFNALLPSGYVGGEPLKAKLLSEDMPLREAAASVLMAKAAQSVGLVLFIGLGLTIGGRSGKFSVLHQPAELTALLFLAVGIGIFLWLLASRGFSRAAELLHRRLPFERLTTMLPRLAALDDSLGAYYRQGRRQFLFSILWHSAGWMAGALELVVLFYLLGTPIHWREGWFIGALAQLGSVVGLFAPAGVGLYEGGHYLAAQMLGLPPALGVTVALIRRVRELFWNMIGILIFWRSTKANR
jgi:uncharacterized protein (TIRG00374 family)